MVSLEIFDALTQSCGANGLSFYSSHLIKILEILINPKKPFSEMKIAATRIVFFYLL
jgi:hypothetical protein